MHPTSSCLVGALHGTVTVTIDGEGKSMSGVAEFAGETSVTLTTVMPPNFAGTGEFTGINPQVGVCALTPVTTLSFEGAYAYFDPVVS